MVQVDAEASSNSVVLQGSWRTVTSIYIQQCRKHNENSGFEVSSFPLLPSPLLPRDSGKELGDYETRGCQGESVWSEGDTEGVHGSLPQDQTSVSDWVEIQHLPTVTVNLF